jgi:hypothetical protein
MPISIRVSSGTASKKRSSGSSATASPISEPAASHRGRAVLQDPAGDKSLYAVSTQPAPLSEDYSTVFGAFAEGLYTEF